MRRKNLQRFSKFIEGVNVLVLYCNVDTDEQSKDESLKIVENSNNIPMNMATVDFLWSENASRNDA